ncbi:MAG: pyrimidine 5'-nucleotidase [Candidatus Schekmanbacteria bacterium]|nr:MAG: pyrimidine 5'-nucleotidase [Candidatus Schekmanbacteria bacterium]
MWAKNKIIIDLDNTLYPEEMGIFTQVNNKINLFLKEKMGFQEDKIDNIRLEYMRRYGTTLRGLMVNFNLAPDEYLRYVHDVEIESILKKDNDLDLLLSELKGEKVIFTNGASFYAERILNALGIKRHFSKIFDIVSMDYIAKPHPYGFDKLMSSFGNGTDYNYLFIDDMAENVSTAKKKGMTTVLIDNFSNKRLGRNVEKIADYVVKKILDIKPYLESTPFI